MKLLEVVKITGKINLISGMSIKGSNNDINIGGIDSEVIKNPISNDPYIPGSSLKGKMRSQLEKVHGYSTQQNRDQSVTGVPCKCGKKDCMTCVIFGAHMNTKAQSSPTRIVVRDANLSEESKRIIAEMPVESGVYLERKSENLIDRTTGTTVNGGLRTIERVPAGLSFDLEILLQIFDVDDKIKMLEYVTEGLKLIEMSSLGGSGSRGYGKVEFVLNKNETLEV